MSADHATGGIDRIAPTRRPDGANAGTQRWRELLFLHWPVPPEVMRPLIPEGLELDLWEGRAWVGLVPFAMEGVRPGWLPEALSFTFLETNARTYVVRDGAPGVWFFSLEAASWLAVQAARLGWGLPYHHARMSLTREGEARVYETTRRAPGAPGLSARFTPGTALGPSAPGTLEHFFLERYYLFAQRSGALWRGQVHHPPYPAQRVDVHELQEDLIAAAGLPAPAEPPAFAHYAAGVDVEVFALERVS